MTPINRKEPVRQETAAFIKRLVDSLRSNGDSIAIVDHDGRQTTYFELLMTACRIAAWLKGMKLTPHSFIGISLPPSMEYIASEIGIWLAGHAIVPMNHAYPEQRKSYIMNHCDSPLLIDESALLNIYETQPSESFAATADNDIAALYYTSGSTGRPKGVLLDFLCYDIPPFFSEKLQSIAPVRMGATAPMNFIVGKYVYAPLLVGGTVFFVPEPVITDVAEFETFIASNQISYLFTTSSVLRNFRHPACTLKLVMAGGDRMSQLEPAGYTLMNFYGQTETGGGCIAFPVDKAYDNTPIGQPILPLEYRVVDDDDNDVEPGEEGELCLKGHFTLGYFNEPELTDALLRDGWLHTGDSVRLLPDGTILYVSRRDLMLKINGQRVDPYEVESMMMRMDGMVEAVVKGFDVSGRQFLCAYFIARPDIEEADIRRYLSNMLPMYMVPSYFMRMDSFPKNAGGKTDLQLLPSPLQNKQHSSNIPQSAAEASLCEAFAQVLGFQDVGPDDNFFTLGGDSIGVMSLQTLCPDLPLTARMIYHNGTPRLIAKACEEVEQEVLSSMHDYPLSQSQLGIYVECMERQGQIAYNNGMLMRLGSGVDLQRLAAAFEKVIAIHPFVKTRLFVNEDGNPRQRRHDNEPFSLNVEKMNNDQFEALKTQLIQPFNLLGDRLFRVRIISTPAASYLFLDFHHIIFDGTSLGILLSDLNKAYRGETLEPELFSGFEVAQEEEMLRNTDTYMIAKDWNLRLFGSLEISSLPIADKSGLAVTFGRQELGLGIDDEQLKQACRRLKTTPNVLTVSAFGYLLGAYTYSQESLFATIYHGRQNLRLNRTVAMLVKTLPVYMKWDRKTTLNALLLATKTQLLGSMGNDTFSFAELKAANSFISSQVLFAYQDDLEDSDLMGGEPFTHLPLMENATGEPLALEVSRHGNSMTLSAEYHSNRYSDAFISRLMQAYLHLVKNFVEAKDGDVPLTDLSLLPTDDCQKLLRMGCGETLRGNVTETFVTLFRRQAALTPDATAIVDKYSKLTYSELDHQSDCLAASLVKAGVVNDTVVALLLPRRKEFLMAAIAVFKAGGAYVSLDYEYPQQRLDYIFSDLNARYLITTSSLAEGRDFKVRFAEGCPIFIDQFDFSDTVPPVDFSRAQSLAYIIYTSGTSGNPKGVMVEHRALSAMLEWLIPMEDLKAGDKCAQHANFSFDASLTDLFGPLTCGAEVHIMSSTLRYDLNAFSHYLLENDIAGLTMSTQIGMELLENHELKLRYLFLGGESLHVSGETPVRIINGYGPTEFTVCSSYHIIDPHHSYDSIPIGRPVPGSHSFVIGPDGHLVPWGAVGELCLAGPQLARGYWGREKLTSKQFTDCPYLPGERMYHTGDLAQWNQYGELMFHGRIDNQVKLRGYRIELSEIESRMSDYPGVHTSAVVLVKQNSIQFLAGFYVADSAVDPEELRNSLTASLPAYMVPLRLVQLDTIPKTSNGKVDSRKLKELAVSVSTGTNDADPPANLREQIIFDLAREMMGPHLKGVTDDLTLLGLTSLDAIKLESLAAKKGVTIWVNDIMQGKTVRRIARSDGSIGQWLNGYEDGKPVMVAIQGFSPYKVQNYFNKLTERFSVYMFVSIDDHFDDAFSQKSKSYVVEHYIDTLLASLPAGVSPYAFTGHCYGGELAYRCAARWQERTGKASRVIVLNTPPRTDDEVRQMMPPQTVIDQMPPERQQKLFDWQHQQERVLALLDNVPMPAFHGEVTFFKATQPFLAVNKLTLDTEAFDRQMDVYMQRWRKMQPQIKVIDVDADHFSMLEEQYSDFYLKKIWENNCISSS